MLRIANATLSAQILPEAGGGLAGFDWHGRGEAIPLMRRYASSARDAAQGIDPNSLACYPLVPWSNRITGSGFDVGGHRIALAPNYAGEPWPIHGSGWQRAWQVETHGAEEAQLSLRESAANAYSYFATMHYALRDTSLQVELAVTNLGSAAIPFGLGLHPYFPRHGEACLLAPAPRVWTNDGQSPLPVACVDVPAEWDFRQERGLPVDLDHAFCGWSGKAAIRWPRLRLGLDIAADADTFVLYAPRARDFFCFEPVDHPIDAVHLPGGAVANGMTLLAPDAVLRRRFVFSVFEPR